MLFSTYQDLVPTHVTSHVPLNDDIAIVEGHCTCPDDISLYFLDIEALYCSNKSIHFQFPLDYSLNQLQY